MVLECSLVVLLSTIIYGRNKRNILQKFTRVYGAIIFLKNEVAAVLLSYFGRRCESGRYRSVSYNVLSA